MIDPTSAMTAIFATIWAAIGPPRERRHGDRGAVSIEQVLWYAAAAVSVAVVAAIVWSQIKSTASTGVNAPSAP